MVKGCLNANFFLLKMHTYTYTASKALVNVFQYYSDIHLEHQASMYNTYNTPKLFFIEPIDLSELDLHLPENTLVTVKRNLILAGDIGNPNSSLYFKFLEDLSHKFDRVFVIAGNHEHYNTELPDDQRYSFLRCIKTEEIPSALLQENLFNVFFLENQSMIMDDFMIIGSTLWSNIPDHARIYVRRDINDYNLIDEFTIDKNNALHAKSVRYIDSTLRDAIDKNIKTRIVISHHAPLMTGTSDPMYNGLTNHAFATDLSDLIEKATHWIYGHTHFNPETPVRENLYTNQVGYRWNSNFKPKAYFSVTRST